MSDRYENIRLALAMEPMPGPWLHDGDGVTADDEDVAVAMCCPSEAEAAYIAACDPDTIRELLEERDALEKVLREIAALDYKNAATNGAAYEAVQIARAALSAAERADVRCR